MHMHMHMHMRRAHTRVCRRGACRGLTLTGSPHPAHARDRTADAPNARRGPRDDTYHNYTHL